jgi:hypothetical protein
MADDMFFSADGKTLRKGRRIAKRTPVTRPAEFWCADDQGELLRGVVKDLSPYGLLLECKQVLPVGTKICVELKKEELFADTLTSLMCKIVRSVETEFGPWHMGVQRLLPPTKTASKPLRITPPKTSAPKRRARRMYNLNWVVGGEE